MSIPEYQSTPSLDTTAKVASTEGARQPIFDKETAGQGRNTEEDTNAITQDGSKENEQNPNYLYGMPFYILFVTLVLAGLLAALNASMLGTAIPLISNEFHTIKDVGWYGASFLIAESAVMPLTGKLFLIFNIKYTFVAFISVFLIGDLVSALAVSSPMLIIGRAIIGIGASGILTGATTVITIVRPIEKRPFLIGVLMGFVALGQVAGPLVGGALAEVTWRWTFYINLPIGGIALFFLVFVAHVPTRSTQSKVPTIGPDGLPITRRQRLLLRMKPLAKIDFVGFIGFSGACSMLLMGLQWGGTTYAWNSGVVIGLICAGVVLFILWAVWSGWKGDDALIPYRVLRYGHINVFCGITALTQAASVFILTYYLPVWFQGIKGASSIMSGVMLLPTIISQFFASVLCGWLVEKTGYYLPEIVLGNAWVVIASGLFTLFRPDTSVGKWIGYQIIGGAGRGFVLQLLVTVIQNNVPQRDIPVGISYVMFCQYFGGAIFICAARTVFSSTIAHSLSKYAPNVSADTVIDTGVADLRNVIAAEDIDGVIMAYNESLVDVFYLQLALSSAALVSSSFLGWKKIGAKNPSKKDIEAIKSTKESTDASS